MSTSLLAKPCHDVSPGWRRAFGSLAAGLSLLVVAPLPGCALTGKAELVGTRYFEPDLSRVARPEPPDGSRTDAPKELQLGRVTASAYLRSRLVYRASDVELGAYDDRQWTERPEEYARRALASSLFGAGHLRQALSGPSPTLDVELAAFEELRQGEQRAGRVTIRYLLHDEESVWATHSITAERPTQGGSQKPEDVVAAISAALSSATTQLAAEVEAQLNVPRTKAPAAE